MAEDKPNQTDAAVSQVVAAPGGLKKLVKLLGLCLGVVAFSSTAGYLAGGVALGKADAPAATQPARSAGANPRAAEEFAYYDFEPIVVNLDEPRLARYIRSAITLAIEQEDYKTASKLIEKNAPEIRSWLTIKLAGCSIESVRGEKNLTRLCREIMDALNAKLWPNERPLIHHVLFKEYAVQ